MSLIQNTVDSVNSTLWFFFPLFESKDLHFLPERKKGATREKKNNGTISYIHV